jgi:hypothetical protein
MDDETAIWHVFFYFFVRDEFDRQSHGGKHNTTGKESNADAKKTTFPGLCVGGGVMGGAESTGEIGGQQSEVNVD